MAILTPSRTRLQSIAEMLEDDDRLAVTTWQGSAFTHADVVLAVETSAARLPEDGPPVVSLGGDVDTMSFSGALRAALPANSSDAEIIAALIAAAANLTVLTPTQAKQLLRQPNVDDEQPAFIEALTPRESEALQMMGEGLSNKEIASRLGISSHTAKFHVAQIMAKLNAASRTEAVSLAIRRGLIPI